MMLLWECKESIYYTYLPYNYTDTIKLKILKPGVPACGQHAPDFLKLILCGSSVCMFVCVFPCARGS